MNDFDDDDAAAAQRRVRPENSEQRNAEAPPPVEVFAAGAARGDSSAPLLYTAGVTAAGDSSSAAALSSPRELLAHLALAMRYFTASERTLQDEGVFGCSPDLDSDKDNGLHRRGSRSLSDCSSDDEVQGCECVMRKAASWAASSVVLHQPVGPAAARVDAPLAQSGRSNSAAATPVPFAVTPPFAELADPSLASPHLPGVCTSAAARRAASLSGMSEAISTTLSLPPPPPLGFVIPAQVVWQADDAMIGRDLLVNDAALSSPSSLCFPAAATGGASPLTSDAQCAVERASIASAASLHEAVRTRARAWWPASSVMPNTEQGPWDSGLPFNGRRRWQAAWTAHGEPATGGWDAEEPDEEAAAIWTENIFDEDGALCGVGLCLWLPCHAAMGLVAVVRCLRRFLAGRGTCAMTYSLLNSASESDGYDSGRDTIHSTEEEGDDQPGATGGTPSPFGAWSGMIPHVRRPLLSSSSNTQCGQRLLQRPGAVRPPRFAREDDERSTNSEEGENIHDAAPLSLSLLPMSSSTQLPPGVTAAPRHQGLGEAAAADTVVTSSHCFLVLCSRLGASLRRGSLSCYRMLSSTVAYYNVFASQRTSVTPTPETGARDAANCHAMPGSSSLPPRLGKHTDAMASISEATRPPPPANAHSLSQPLLLDIAFVSQMFVLLQYVGLTILTATVLLLTVFLFDHFRVAYVEEETAACNRYPFENRIPPEVSFSLICLLLNGVLAVRYAVRAVRYEKGGLLIVQVVIVALQVCRATYFLLIAARSYTQASSVSSLSRPLWPLLITGLRRPIARIFSSGVDASGSEGVLLHEHPTSTVGSVQQALLVLTCVNVGVSVSLFVAASLLSPWVYASFGWRRYAQGIVQVSLSRVRQRLTVLRACVKLDGVVTANAYLAAVFLLDSWPDQRKLLLMTLTIFALHYVLIPMLRRSRHWWPLLLAAGVLVTVSAYYAVVVGGALRNDQRLRSASNSPWHSNCYRDRLHECLYEVSCEHPVSIFRDAFATDGADDSHPSSRQLERARPPPPPPPPSSPAVARQRTFCCGATRGVPLLHGHLSARESLRATSPSFALAVLSRLASSMRRVSNATDTYLPTHSTFPDYSRVQGCNAACFLAREEKDNVFFERSIAGCCAEYGQCLHKDGYRTYAVLLLLVLTVFSSVVRAVLLVVAWRRWVERDDVTIDHFVWEHLRRHHCSGYRRQRRRPRKGHGHRHQRADAAAAGVSDTPSQSPRRLRASYNAIFPASSPLPSIFPHLTQNLAWNVEQYAAWRQQQCAAESTIWREHGEP
ncbi:hypothetical protein MNV84_05049 [Leishmania braziliensis]|nr:hypothetical protein MNV84_05049 [Leishmania braziliensis]